METNSGKVGKMRDKFRKGGGKFRKNHRISGPKDVILQRAVTMILKLNNCKGYHTKIFVNSEVKMI